MIKTWIFEFVHIQGRQVSSEAYEDPQVVQQTFDDTFTRLAGAEATGFEGVFLSEHHFMDALSSAPNLILAALARETRTLRLGVMGNVLPFHQPWRLAEELGTLDYICRGRLEIGMSSGVPLEFGFVNIAQGDARAIYAEAQEVLERAAKEREVTFKGKFFDFEEVPLLPRLRPEPRRRRWVTLYSEETARKAAALQHRICSAYIGCETYRKVVEAYHEESRKHGFATGPEDIGLRRHVLICDSDSQAAELQAEFMVLQKQRVEDRIKPAMERLKRDGPGMSEGVRKTGTIDAAAPAREAIAKGETNPLAAITSIEDEFIFGSPKTVAERMIDQCRRSGAGNIMAHHSPVLTTEETADMYRRLWPQVLQITAKAGVAPETV